MLIASYENYILYAFKALLSNIDINNIKQNTSKFSVHIHHKLNSLNAHNKEKIFGLLELFHYAQNDDPNCNS